MAKRLIDYDAFTGMQVWHEYDSVTKVTTIAEVQDCQPIIEAHKAIQAMDTPGGRLNGYERKGIKYGWAHVATIPPVIISKWMRDYGINVFNKDHAKAVAKKLNDPEWRYLRTGSMRV